MLPASTVLALAAFAVVAAGTPGPNNIMLTASGVNFGFRRTIPHLLGVLAGFVVLLLGVGFGVGSLFVAVPQAELALKVVGALYMLWLAWRIANAGSPAAGGRQGPRPMTFIEAAAFQWVNPKAWVMVLAAMSLYVRSGHVAADVLIVTSVFAVVTVPASSLWTAFGHVLGSVLSSGRRVRVFNVAMALLLVASIVPMVA